jgi:hypothetical protein
MKKNAQIITNVEPPIQEAFEHLCARMQMSQSGQVRLLIIEHLKAHGVLPPNMAVEILTA